MKRPVQPVSEYQDHERYPSFVVGGVDESEGVGEGAGVGGGEGRGEGRGEGGGVSRRAFLGKAGAAAAVAAGAVILPTAARATWGDKDKRQKVSLYLGRVQVGKSSMSAQRVIVFTGDKNLARWLKSYSNRRSITQALSPILRKAKDDVLVDGKKLYGLERKIGAALVRHYRKKTGKTARQPDLMMIVGRYWRPRMLGRMPRPYYRRRIRP